MERSSTIGYVLIFFLFIGFYYFNSQNQEVLEEQSRKANEIALADSLAAIKNTEATISSSDIASDDSSNTIEVIEESIVSLENDLMSIDFTTIGGIPKKVNIKDYHRYDSSDLVLFEDGQMSLGYSIPLVNGDVINTASRSFTAEKNGNNQVILTSQLPNEAKIIQTYTLDSNSYKVGYNVQFENIGKIISPNNRYAELKWTAEVQGQEKTLKDERAATTIYYNYSGDNDVDYLSETSSDDEKLEANVKWVSFKQKFFNQTLINRGQFIETGTKL
ncbi:MAG: membrane protein insertase YidC, partial [Bacteroidia bacterium]